MRYVIKESPDRGERNHYFESSVMPIIGHTVGHNRRYYEVMDIEFADHFDAMDAQNVRVLVRRLV